MKYLLKIHTFFKNLSTFKFIIIMTFLTFATSILFSPIIYFLRSFSQNPSAGPGAGSDPFIYEVFMYCLLAPMFETLVFQTLIISELRKIKKVKMNNIMIILISSLVFGLTHYYNIGYIFHAFVLGILLAYSYVIYENKDPSAFWVVTCIHTSRNFISLLIGLFI